MLRPTTDSVDAKLTPREAVLNRNAAELAGRGNITQLNHMGNMMAQQGIDLPTLHAQQGTEDVNMNNPRYYDEGTGSVQSNLPYDPSYPGPTNPTGAGSGVPTQKGIGLGANILGNLIFPGAGMLTGPLASWITKMMQGNSAQNQVQGAVQGTGQQPTNPVTPGGYGSQPVWGDNPYPGGFDPNASFNYGNPAGPNTQSGIGQLGSSGPGGGFFGSTVPGGNEQNFMPTLGVAMPDAGGGGAYGGNEMAKIAMHGAFHDIATPEQYEYVKQFLSGGGGGGGGGKGVGGGGKPMTQAYAGGTSNVQIGGLGGLQTQPYQQPMQMGGMGSQVGQLGVGSQVGQLGGVGGMPDRNFAHPMAGLMHPDMPRNFPHPNAGLMHPGIGALGGGTPGAGFQQQPAAVGNTWGGGFNTQGVPIAPAGGWNMQNSGYTGNPAEYGTMQSQVGHYETGTSDVWQPITDPNDPRLLNTPLNDPASVSPPPAPAQPPTLQTNQLPGGGYSNPLDLLHLPLSAYTPGKGNLKVEGKRETSSGAPMYTYEDWKNRGAPYVTGALTGPGSKAPGHLIYRTIGGETVPVAVTDRGPGEPGRPPGLDIAYDNANYAKNYPYQGQIDNPLTDAYGQTVANVGQMPSGTYPSASSTRQGNPSMQSSFATNEGGIYRIDPTGDYAKAVAGTGGPSEFGEGVGRAGKALSSWGAHMADIASQQAQTATSQGLSMIGGIGGNPYERDALSAYYASLQNPTVFR